MQEHTSSLDAWIIQRLVRQRFRDRLSQLGDRSRRNFLRELFRPAAWRMELFAQVPPQLRPAELVELLRSVQSGPVDTVALSDLDQRRVAWDDVVASQGLSGGLLAVTGKRDGAYLELEGKNTIFVMGRLREVLPGRLD